MRSRSVLTVTTIGLIVLAAMFVGGWLLVRSLFGIPPETLLRYQATSTGITVYAERQCGERLGETHVEESADRVEVKIDREKSDRNQICAAIYTEWEIEVALDAPVGDRAVYDAGCLERDRSDTECRLPAASAAD